MAYTFEGAMNLFEETHVDNIYRIVVVNIDS